MATSSKPLRVLFIRDHLAWSGGTVYLLETLPRLSAMQVEPTLCVLHPWCAAAREFETVGIRPVFLERVKRDPRRLFDLLRLSREIRPHVLHLLGPKSFLLGRLVARQHRRPAIPHFHSMLPEGPVSSLAQRRLASSTAAGLAPAAVVQMWAAREYALPAERIEVLPNGHDVDRFASPGPHARERVRAELDVAPDAEVIGLVGRVLSSQKGQDLMIRLMPEVLRRRPHSVLLVVGEGPDLEVCRRSAAAAGLGAAVRFLGHRDDIPAILAAVDLAVVPSLCEEAFPFVALEASAAGRPVVAFRSGGLPDIVLHDETGVVVPKGDSAGLIDAITSLLCQPIRARQLGENGRRHAQQFTLGRHVERLSAIYQQVLTRTPSM